MSKLTVKQKRWQSIIEGWRQRGLTQLRYCHPEKPMHEKASRKRLDRISLRG